MAAAEFPVVVGRYAVYGPFASGGMATVHLGRLAGSVGFSRTVAVKRMHPAFLTDPEFVAMFGDEARVASRIRHPNVVSVIDVVSTKTELLLVMEYVQGETLSRLMRLADERETEVPPAIAAAIVHDALMGLHAAHEAKDERGALLGIVHRDVSPQNIMVGVDGVARVLDFGVAKAAGRSSVTREGHVKGKLAYMAPEQLHGDVTRATDIFAASAVLWELVTRERLFRGVTDTETVMKVLGATIRKPSEVRPSLGTAYDDVVMTGLARRPQDRFASAREMALALAKAAELADESQVGEWVCDIAKERLIERERVVTEVESGVYQAAPVSSAPGPEAATRSASLPPSRRGRSLAIATVAALVLVGAGVALARVAARAAASPTTTEPLALPSAAATPSQVLPPASTTPPTEVATAPSQAPASTSTTTVTLPPSTRGSPTRPAANPPPPARRIPDHL